MKKRSPDISINTKLPQINKALSTTVFDSGLYIAWMSDENGYLTRFNNKWINFTGNTIEEEQGFGWTNAFKPKDLVRFLYTYLNAFNNLKEFKIKYRLRRYDGNYYWISNHGWPIVDGSNTFLGYIGLCDLLGREKKSNSDKHLQGNSISFLTKRERQVIELVIQGYRNKQIAKKLKISSNTVRNHIFNIFSKYKVSNRVQLINQIAQPKL